jgi:uncharacterized repeat protein (TIGR01451 family)
MSKTRVERWKGNGIMSDRAVWRANGLACCALTAFLLSACTGSAPPKPGGSGGAAGHVGLGGMGGSSTSTGGTGAGGATTGHAGNGGGGTSAGGGSGGSTAGTGGGAGAAGGAAGGGLAGAGGAAGGAGSGSGGVGGTSAGTGGSAGAAGSSAGGAAGSPTGGAGGATGGAAGIAGGAGGGLGGGYQPPASPLTFDVSTTADPVAAGGRLLYTVTIGNVSNVSVDGVTLTWLLPTGVQFYYTTDVAPDPNSGWNTSGNFTAGSQATWNIGSVAAGSMRTVVINALVLTSVGDGDSISASFKLTATGVNPATFTKVVQVYAESSAQLSTGSAVNPVVPGHKFTLDVDVGQIGTQALANAALQTTLSPGLSVVSISDGGTQTSPGVISWSVGSLGVGLATHRSVDLAVDGNVPAGALLTTHTTLTYDGGLAVDAAADYTVRVIAAAPYLNLAVAAVPGPVVPGARLGYTATVTNTSTRSIDGVGLLLRGPTGLQFYYTTDAAPDVSSGWNTSGNLVAGSEGYWSLGTIASGDSRTVFIDEQVLANVVGNGNLIRADFQTWATGIDVIDDVRTVQVYDSPGAQLALGATANPVTNAQAFSYTVDVGQIGTTALANAQLKLWLPPHLAVNAINGGGAQDASGAVVWSIGSIGVGANGHYTVAVTGDGTAIPGTILYARTALTYDGGAEVDALTDYAIPVVAAAQGVTMTVTASPNPAVPGNRLLYTATITNTTARSVDSVTLLLLVPVGLQFHYTADVDPDTSSGWNTSGLFTAGSEAYWSLGTLAAGATQIVTINAQVLTSLLGGSLIPTQFWLSAGGQDAPVLVPVTVPAN